MTTHPLACTGGPGLLAWVGIVSLPLLDPLGGESPLVEGIVNEDLQSQQKC